MKSTRPNSQRYKITATAGEQYGHLIALETMTWHPTARIRVQCAKCGYKHAVSLGTLVDRRDEAERTGATRNCKRCNPERAVKTTRWCSQCGNNTDRRPRFGLCKCGQPFREQVPLTYDHYASREGLGSILVGGTIHV